MKKIHRQLLYALSAILIGIVCAAFLIFLAKYISKHFVSNISYQSPYDAKLSPAEEQAMENKDEDIVAPISTSTSSKPHVVTASHYLVIDLTDNTNLYSSTSSASSSATSSPFILSARTILEKDSDRSVPIASITKLVTAVIAQNILIQNPAIQNPPIQITSQILAVDGNTAQFRQGEKFSANELLYPLLIVSSNDSAEALAQSDPKGRADFIRNMNAWVNSIGAYHTYFADPTGLSPENVSSADDLAIIIRWIYAHRPDLIAITATKVENFRTHTWTNPTQLLNLSAYQGGKNGYIPQSGETAVSLFKVGKKQFAVVVLNSSNRDMDILELMHEATGVAYITYEN